MTDVASLKQTQYSSDWRYSHSCICTEGQPNVNVLLLQRLQSVQNSAAPLIYRLRRSEHITDVLLSLHWLRVRERVEYKVAVLTYKVLNGLAPPYLSSAFTHVADVPSRRRLRSASTNQLLVPSCRRSTIGRRAFPIAGARV